MILSSNVSKAQVALLEKKSDKMFLENIDRIIEKPLQTRNLTLIRSLKN